MFQMLSRNGGYSLSFCLDFCLPAKIKLILISHVEVLVYCDIYNLFLPKPTLDLMKIQWLIALLFPLQMPGQPIEEGSRCRHEPNRILRNRRLILGRHNERD